MALPKSVAAAACIGILGAQIAIASPPFLNRYGWHWPFLPYPMYALAHARSDSLVLSELRAAECGRDSVSGVITPESLGTPLYQLPNLLTSIARAPESEAAHKAMDRVSRAVEAQYPGRYCSASAWVRTVFVADTATHGLNRPMHRSATWAVVEKGKK